MNDSTGDRTRVLIVGQGPPTAGGIPTFVSSLVSDEGLRDRFDVDFFNMTPQKTKRPGAFSISNFTLLFKHAFEVFRRARRVDVVHLNLAPAPLLPLLRAIALILAARAGRARVILHAHTGRLHLAAKSAIYRAALRVAIRAASELVVVSHYAEEAVRSIGRTALYLPNGIDVEGIPTGPKDVDPLRLAFVGTVCERKGLLDLRDALQLLKNRHNGELPFHVAIIGDAKQEGPGVFERVQEGYASGGLNEVEFTGAMDRSKVLEALGHTSIFCLPSHWEGFPLSLLEAMAAGNAIVATDVGDISDMLDNGTAGMVVPLKDPVRLGDALAALVADPEERARLGVVAHNRVQEHYSQKRLTGKLAELYEHLGRHST